MTEPKKRSWFQTYKGWHTDDDKLWREIYARTVATLLAAFIAYLIAIVAVGADPAPLRLILLVATVGFLAVAEWMFLLNFTGDYQQRHSKLRLFVMLFALILCVVCWGLYQQVDVINNWEWLTDTLRDVIVLFLAIGFLFIFAVVFRRAFRRSRGLPRR